MTMPIVIRILENPKQHSFRELRFLSCANSCPTLSQTAGNGVAQCIIDWTTGLGISKYRPGKYWPRWIRVQQIDEKEQRLENWRKQRDERQRRNRPRKADEHD
ncbi:hypothetical protein PRIPAC_70910 [Pristionchus pacificus]|uniref:Uncharacterized protein n=1 Tax=Pristionchus pacificus TaxID=54126 RepID=A0A2A6CZV9_PRIPA|nr:hypothetical protein PRIPAC_70910 [Pristionchus pacificus]|eukprot:PDM83695.1 hypothetical protein PRIPAC_30182 [Pristionchus pacificus]